MKNFLIIPILIFVYIFLVGFILQGENKVETSQSQGSGNAAVIRVSQSISVTVTRPYLFGLIELPVYMEGVGNIGVFHDTFFMLIFILTAILIIIEIKKRKEIKGKKTKRKRR